MATATAEASAPGITRREFLYYIWGASMALYTAELAGLIVWFALPRFRAGEFGGKFDLAIEDLPPINDPPVDFAAGRFWLVNLDTTVDSPDGNPLEQGQDLMYLAPDEDQPIKGAAAIYKVCTHLGCIYAWNGANKRFECPCHGSKYRLDGRRIESPAPRSLDRFHMEALDADGNVLASSTVGPDGAVTPLEIPAGTVTISVDTGAREQGPTKPLLCDFAGNCP
ncbi:MAG TPA: Rieske 2Fe-2S domain-containing protein [Anaerolineae bacterium]|nr:Rieske 2Fe-2S domain-containing protein [Anaerolineae bacterium]